MLLILKRTIAASLLILAICSTGCSKWWSSSNEPAPCGTVTVAAPVPPKPETTRLVFEVKVTPEVGSSTPVPQLQEPSKQVTTTTTSSAPEAPAKVQVTTTVPSQPAPQTQPAK